MGISCLLCASLLRWPAPFGKGAGRLRAEGTEKPSHQSVPPGEAKRSHYAAQELGQHHSSMQGAVPRARRSKKTTHTKGMATLCAALRRGVQCPGFCITAQTAVCQCANRKGRVD